MISHPELKPGSWTSKDKSCPRDLGTEENEIRPFSTNALSAASFCSCNLRAREAPCWSQWWLFVFCVCGVEKKLNVCACVRDWTGNASSSAHWGVQIHSQRKTETVLSGKKTNASNHPWEAEAALWTPQKLWDRANNRDRHTNMLVHWAGRTEREFCPSLFICVLWKTWHPLLILVWLPLLQKSPWTQHKSNKDINESHRSKAPYSPIPSREIPLGTAMLELLFYL